MTGCAGHFQMRRRVKRLQNSSAHPSPAPTAPIVRFAPSPTGRIHIGNARTALLNFFFARKHGGTFLLRFDDTDSERSTEEYALGIEVDLAWLGVTPDADFRQSERFALYDAAARQLKEAGTALSLLRDAGGAGAQAPPADRARRAAGL